MGCGPAARSAVHSAPRIYTDSAGTWSEALHLAKALLCGPLWAPTNALKRFSTFCTREPCPCLCKLANIHSLCRSARQQTTDILPDMERGPKLKTNGSDCTHCRAPIHSQLQSALGLENNALESDRAPFNHLPPQVDPCSVIRVQHAFEPLLPLRLCAGNLAANLAKHISQLFT